MAAPRSRLRVHGTSVVSAANQRGEPYGRQGCALSLADSSRAVAASQPSHSHTALVASHSGARTIKVRLQIVRSIVSSRVVRGGAAHNSPSPNISVAGQFGQRHTAHRLAPKCVARSVYVQVAVPNSHPLALPVVVKCGNCSRRAPAPHTALAGAQRTPAYRSMCDTSLLSELMTLPWVWALGH